MQELFDEDFDSIELVEGALILNEAINPETQVHWAHQELSRLLKEAELALVAERHEQT
ncbi:SirB1 family protein, partial [Vibrio campbellii]